MAAGTFAAHPRAGLALADSGRTIQRKRGYQGACSRSVVIRLQAQSQAALRRSDPEVQRGYRPLVYAAVASTFHRRDVYRQSIGQYDPSLDEPLALAESRLSHALPDPPTVLRLPVSLYARPWVCLES